MNSLINYLKNRLQIQILLVIGILLPAILIATQSVSIKWLIYGPLIWLIALLLKIFVFGSIQFTISRYTKNKLFLSILWGIQSAIAELGTTIYFFYRSWNELNLKNVLSFGIGVGIIEIFYLIRANFINNKNKEEAATDIKLTWFVSWSGVFERAYTLLSHVFSRAIIWIGMFTESNYFLILIAFVLFSIVDGAASYGSYKKWDFLDPITAKKFHLSMFTISVLEGLLFLILIKKFKLI